MSSQLHRMHPPPPPPFTQESRSPTPQDIITALQRRIQELEVENRQLRASGKRPRAPSASAGVRFRAREMDDEDEEDEEETHSICHHEKVGEEEEEQVEGRQECRRSQWWCRLWVQHNMGDAFKGGSKAAYPLGRSRFSWPPPGSPSTTPGGTSLAALLQASELLSHTDSIDSEFSDYTPPLTPSSLAFTDFLMVGVRSSILNGTLSPAEGDQPLEVHERFAWGLDEGTEVNKSPLPSHLENITQFCFPHGAQLELAPISQVETLTGCHRDQTHVLQFTDATHAITYGVCMTIMEVVKCPPSVVRKLQEYKQRQLALQEAQKKAQGNCRRRSGSLDTSNDGLERIDEGEEKGAGRRSRGPSQEGGLVGDEDRGMMMRRKLFSPFGLAIRNRVGMLPGVEGADADVSSLVPPSFSLVPRLERTQSDNLDVYRRCQDQQFLRKALHAKTALREEELTIEPEEEEEEEEEEEMVVIVPRCFCLISQIPNHPVLARVLHIIIERERSTLYNRWGNEMSSTNSTGATSSMIRSSKLRRRHSCTGLALRSFEHPPASSEDRKSARWQFLRYLQADVTFPPTGSITVSCGRYQNVLARFDFPLVSLEYWTTAVAFSRLSAEVIVKAVNLLLLEQSLVIVGDDLGLVSAIGTALITLLAPFQWDGIFIPILPLGLSEILNSPVPYVVGLPSGPCFDYNRYPNASVLHVGKSGETLRIPPMETKLPLCYKLLQEINEHNKIFCGRRTRWANLHLTTYMGGLTIDERQAVDGLRGTFITYIEHLCGDLKYPDAWRKYGAFNSTTHEFEFYPTWFMGPLQMMLDFQSTIVRTQMFVGYIDRRRTEDLKNQRHRLQCQNFIGRFCYFKYLHRKRKEKQEHGEEEDDEVRRVGLPPHADPSLGRSQSEVIQGLQSLQGLMLGGLGSQHDSCFSTPTLLSPHALQIEDDEEIAALGLSPKSAASPCATPAGCLSPHTPSYKF